MAPSFYDPESPEEQPVPLPSAPRVNIDDNIVLQPPLTRKGAGPGLIAFLPGSLGNTAPKPTLDPEPIQKWAEEGFSVAGITCKPEEDAGTTTGLISKAIDALLDLKELDTRDKFALIVYDTTLNLNFHHLDGRIACIIAFGSGTMTEVKTSLPTLLHLPASNHGIESQNSLVTVHKYTNQSPHFVHPYSKDYDPGSSTVAHTRSLVFLRKHLGGPIFDVEAIWDEHCYFEFEVRSVAKTMATMVAEPYVNHVPTMTGGIGRKSLTEFYRDHFIFANPPDTRLQLISRTVGADRVVDEFIFHLTHDRTIDWLLPGVPPTGKTLAIPMMGVINIRGDRLYHEHIWWDQGTVLKQAGVLPSHVPFPTTNGNKMLRLPIAGIESAKLLADEFDGRSNEMLGQEWGISES